MRFGFSRGSATLATMSNWSTLETMTWRRPRTAREMRAVPRLDALDQTLFGLQFSFVRRPRFGIGGCGQRILPASRVRRAKEHAVAGDHRVALVGAERLQDPPRGALIGGAVVAQHRAAEPEDREHAAAAAGRFVDVQDQVERRLGVAQIRPCLGRANRAVAIHFAPAADPLFRFRGLLLKTVLVKLPRPVGLAGTRRAIFAKFSPELLLFRHRFQSLH